ncbi:MAG: cob(I)yrinic acid a,c-diamide adenosyltransferase [Planctomycetes bacterium]|nr:cob(I)yrinic acid a,c-diamide adenosyltransferase [Planctomycetota bacterium]
MTAKIYTKTGDDGQTGLFGGPRVAKDDARIEAYGAVDELNALLGLARCESPPAELDELLVEFQHDLFALGAELATPDPAKLGTNWIGASQIGRLEQAIDHHDALVPPLSQFILPGGSKTASLLHVARTVCRRAERRVVTLARESQQPISPQTVIYLNRLGDLLFVLARRANALAGSQEEPWRKPQ